MLTSSSSNSYRLISRHPVLHIKAIKRSVLPVVQYCTVLSVALVLLLSTYQLMNRKGQQKAKKEGSSTIDDD